MRRLNFRLLDAVILSALGLIMANQSLAHGRRETTHRADRTATLESSLEGPWGSWQEEKFCEPNSYATGIYLNVEPPQGPNTDDTALNNVGLYCQQPIGFHHYVWGESPPIPDAEGGTLERGAWGELKKCGRNKYLTGFQLQVGPPIDGDNTAVNSLNARCNDGTLLTPSNGISSGSWGDFAHCPAETAICGVSLKWAFPLENGDATAVNNVRFMCCYLDNGDVRFPF